jgi:hypothetical protein
LMVLVESQGSANRRKIGFFKRCDQR